MGRLPGLWPVTRQCAGPEARRYGLVSHIRTPWAWLAEPKPAPGVMARRHVERAVRDRTAGQRPASSDVAGSGADENDILRRGAYVGGPTPADTLRLVAARSPMRRLELRRADRAA
jgi:hypothetical protein